MPRTATPFSRKRRGVLALAVLIVFSAGAAMHEVINASNFQLFGDYVVRVETTEKVVALTFDDGPHPAFTPRLLDALDRHHIKATFFMMGRNVERFPAVARDVLARGHEIGNHSYSHPKMIWMWPSSVRQEIQRTDDLLRGIGVPGEILFRPPHAAKLIVLPYVLVQMKKLTIYGDVDVEEWKQPPAEVMTRSALQQVRPGSIIGLHDVLGAETLKTAENLMTELTSQGYRFETVSELIKRRRE